MSSAIIPYKVIREIRGFPVTMQLNLKQQNLRLLLFNGSNLSE